MTSEGNIKISPHPAGKDFSFSIIDDTDHSWGDEIVPVYELLHSLGYKTTKTVWVFDQKYTNTFRKDREKEVSSQEFGVSLQDKSYCNYIKALENRGFEIALHGVSAGNDYREDIRRGYNRFKEIFGYYPRIDILHSQNIENLYCGSHKFDFLPLKIMEKLLHNSDYLGHVPGSDYFWGDIAKEHIDYIRLPFHEIKEINLLKINPTFPFHDPRRPYVKYWFINSDGADYNKFMDLTNNKNMEKLENENGATIIYTHFANGFTYKNGDKYLLKQPFENRMNDIRSRNGWFAPASQILDRFVQIRKLKLLEDTNTLSIINTGESSIENVTILSKQHQVFRDSNGNINQSDKDGKIIVPRIERASVKILWKVDSCEEYDIRDNEKISMHEHIGIELYNYLGRLF